MRLSILQQQGEGWSDFELRIRLTYDFTTPLLARGANIQVLEPPFLADEIRLLHEEAAQVYSGEDLPEKELIDLDRAMQDTSLDIAKGESK